MRSCRARRATGFVATVLALDESAQRAAGARTAHADAGCTCRPRTAASPAAASGWRRRQQRFVDEPYVDLVVDADSVANGDFEEIFAHEMGHVFLRRLVPDLPLGYSRTPHASMSITDYPTAFDEGFATHFQGLVRR